MDNITISKASFADSEALKNFMLLALKEDPTAFSVNVEEYQFNSNDWWNSYLYPFLYQYNASMTLAKVADEIVGMVGVLYQKGLRRNHLAMVVWFYVKKDFRGKKIGKKLMDSLLEEIKANKQIIKISLSMNSPQKKAMEIYKKYGFKQVGTLEREMKINGEFVDEYIMELMLD